MSATVLLTPVVRFREFPFGIAADPSIREAIGDRPQAAQARLLDYLRSGVILGVTMGADLADHLDPRDRANPVVQGRKRGGLTEMTDGVWFWYAGLIHYVEKYNLRLPQAFAEHAAREGWRVNHEAVPAVEYDCSYFEPR